MSENEKKLRELIALTDMPASVTAYLDATLAEHLAEVERLETKVREVLDGLRNVKTCGQGAYADGIRRAAVEALRLLGLDASADPQS